MMREEAIVYFEKILAGAKQGLEEHPEEGKRVYGMRKELAEIALTALRPVSREQVEKVFERCQHSRVCGTCKVCVSGRYQQANFCAVCGAPLTDEAVDILLKRLEALYGQEEAD